ncbi:hypothetical protein CLAFUW4_07093 [Fulvia fulva]|nr:hypothetical protein CLAFUR4_07102 [Fulvia fulva]KAK4622991.1 hypothetical protein CLAFUR0_07100 [Fulvia fulva]WPV16063.1 hypothetical protein CLAFUW4_07093 [Fulvia fulva]
MSGAPGPPGAGGWPTYFGKGKGRQDAADLDASGSSSCQWWSYCRDCDRVPDDVMACIQASHELPNLWTTMTVLNPAYTDNDNDITQSTAFSLQRPAAISK